MTISLETIVELETFLSNPLTFSTFHTWSSPEKLHRTADIYFSTARDHLPDWTQHTFRDYFAEASVREQLFIHEILELENQVPSEAIPFLVSNEQVTSIEKCFNQTKVDEDLFGKVILQLNKEQIYILLGRVEEVERTSRERVERKRERRRRKSFGKLEQKGTGFEVDMVDGKTRRRRAKRKSGSYSSKQAGAEVNSREGEHGVGGDVLDITSRSTKESVSINDCAEETLPALIPSRYGHHDKFGNTVLKDGDNATGFRPLVSPKRKSTTSNRKRSHFNEDDVFVCKKPKKEQGKGGERKLSREQKTATKVAALCHHELESTMLSVTEAKSISTAIGQPDSATKLGSPMEVTIKDRDALSMFTSQMVSQQQQDENAATTAILVSEFSTPRRKTRSQTVTTTATPRTPPLKRSPAKSPFFSAPLSTSTRSPTGTVSCMPFPPLSFPRFGLAQESLAQNPFHLLVAVQFLNKTKGSVAMPVFRSLISTYPTPELLGAARIDDIVPRIRHLGLQNQRAAKIVALAQKWLEAPPVKGKRYRTLHYPCLGAGKEIKPAEIVDDDDAREGAWEVAHLPGVGDYAIDSWRIFCRDVLRGVAEGWMGEGATVTSPISNGAYHSREEKEEEEEEKRVTTTNQTRSKIFEPEWKRVLPRDKELRAYLRWMWLKEGWLWDPLSGKRCLASEQVKREAEKGDLAWRTKEEGSVITNIVEIAAVSAMEIDGPRDDMHGNAVKREVIAQVILDLSESTTTSKYDIITAGNDQAPVTTRANPPTSKTENINPPATHPPKPPKSKTTAPLPPTTPAPRNPEKPHIQHTPETTTNTITTTTSSSITPRRSRRISEKLHPTHLVNAVVVSEHA